LVQRVNELEDSLQSILQPLFVKPRCKINIGSGRGHLVRRISPHLNEVLILLLVIVLAAAHHHPYEILDFLIDRLNSLPDKVQISCLFFTIVRVQVLIFSFTKVIAHFLTHFIEHLLVIIVINIIVVCKLVKHGNLPI
jgi:hypothetical protein